MAILQVVEWIDQSGREIVKRVPERGSGEFTLGSQLIVRESQVAVFYRDGKALDTFGPGRHTLSTQNLPLLANLFRIPFGQSPFKAEVYFVSTKTFTDMKWGTPQPVTLRDADLGMVRLRAFGTYSMQIQDAALFVNTIVGTQSLYQTGEITDYLRSIIVSRLTDIIGSMGIPFLDLPSRFEEISAAVKVRIRDQFAALGIDLRGFYLESVSPTEETQKAIDERASMGAIGDMQSYLQYKAARAMGEAAQNQGEAGSMAGAGFGLGAGAGMGAIMAQILGQSMQQPQRPSQTAPAPGETTESSGTSPTTSTEIPSGAATVEQAFTAIELLVSRQLAVPQAERNTILQKLAKMEVELAKPDTDLTVIKSQRKEIADQWPWLKEELDTLFRQPVVEREMAEAARRFMEG
ncbi:MAG: SPFH domain-containing protein [Chloroflexota bacterium]|nr:SPFH domain-containing protein [Chloroflexota bacterium]